LLLLLLSLLSLSSNDCRPVPAVSTKALVEFSAPVTTPWNRLVVPIPVVDRRQSIDRIIIEIEI